MWFYFDDKKDKVLFISNEVRILDSVNNSIFQEWLIENGEPEIYVEEQYFASLEVTE